MDVQELQQRIAAFPRWHYRFEFDGGVTTPIFDERFIPRHEQRRRYFFDALLGVTGGSLRGHRVLDLGCNAGFWSLAAIDAGADFVLGVDGRQMHVDQAKLVFEAKGIEESRYRFEEGNIFEHDFGEQFDVVLCLGLMYHIAKPVALFELFARVGAELVVIDTNVSRAPSSFFEVRHEASLDEPRSAVDYEVVLVPTRQAVIELASQFGFETVPVAHDMGDYSGLEGYRDKLRVAFVCSKSASLDAVPKETPPATTSWWRALRHPSRRGWVRPPG